MTTKRGGKRRTSFQPGQSGNPGGRPKLTEKQRELRELAREKTTRALGVLEEVMNDRKASPSARVAAASELLDRGWGRAHQSVSADVNDTGLARVLILPTKQPAGWEVASEQPNNQAKKQ